MSKYFCPLPFRHVHLKSNGDFNVCCRHIVPEDKKMNVINHRYNDWVESEYHLEVRNTFLQGKRHPGCHDCWQAEDNGFQSFRKKASLDYQIVDSKKDYNLFKPLIIEIVVTNKCNLRCFMCSENNSSSILNENIKLGVNKKSHKDYIWTKSSFDSLKDLLEQQPKIINILGGEPFLITELYDILNGMNSNQASKIALHITTNATTFSKKWKQLLEKFRFVRVMFSVDATNDLYNYMRYPGIFTDVEKNITEIISLPNTKPLINCVIQNLNILYLKDIILFAKKLNIWLNLSILSTPNYLQFFNLPDHLKSAALENVQDAIKLVKNDNDPSVFRHKEQLESIVAKLQTEKFDNHMWNQFISFVEPRDKNRKTNHKQFLDY